MMMGLRCRISIRLIFCSAGQETEESRHEGDREYEGEDDSHGGEETHLTNADDSIHDQGSKTHGRGQSCNQDGHAGLSERLQDNLTHRAPGPGQFVVLCHHVKGVDSAQDQEQRGERDAAQAEATAGQYDNPQGPSQAHNGSERREKHPTQRPKAR